MLVSEALRLMADTCFMEKITHSEKSVVVDFGAIAVSVAEATVGKEDMAELIKSLMTRPQYTNTDEWGARRRCQAEIVTDNFRKVPIGEAKVPCWPGLPTARRELVLDEKADQPWIVVWQDAKDVLEPLYPGVFPL